MPDLLIDVSEGKIKGGSRLTSTGFQYNYYLGIPFAKPPVGKLRFRNPQYPDKWDGIRDATYVRDVNPQFMQCFEGDEDSLFLNVYTPSSANIESKLPVIFYIHGGGFYWLDGYSDKNRPDNLIDKDVVYVSTNYRLGILGFLCLHDENAPGNVGLKDQVFALRWVQKNIHLFGGDPQNVTLMGSSAGGASVHYHIMSPMSRGLFTKAIMQSGSCISSWAVQSDPEKNAFNVARKLGCNSIDKNEVIDFLTKVPIKDLIESCILEYNYAMNILFCGVVESEFKNCEAFLTESTFDLMQTGNYNNVPCILGLNSHEGIMYLTPDVRSSIENGSFHLSAEEMKVLIKRYTLLEVTLKQAEAVHSFYFNRNDDVTQAFIKLFSDMYFVLSVMDSAKTFQRNQESVFVYNFSHFGPLTQTTHGMNGASHGDDYEYLLTKTNLENIMSDSDKNVRRIITTLWTNFAKFRNPTPENNNPIANVWLPIKDGVMQLLDINENPKMIKNPYEERIDFWKNILPNL